MSDIIEINYNEIPDSDIREYPKSDNRIDFDRDLIGNITNIVLDNTDDKFSDTNPQSIFYGVEWMDKLVTIYNTEQGIYTWVGRIKNITQKDSDGTVIIKTANFIYEMNDITCVYAASGITVADAMYNIFNDVVGVPPEFLNYGKFLKAINIQTLNSATINIDLDASDNRKCLEVIQSLRRMSLCDVYTVDNIIEVYQWQKWDGVLGYRIKPQDIIPLTFESWFEEEIYNAYNIIYKNGANIATASDFIPGTNGDKVFTIPKDKIESTLSADFKIIYTNLIGANWIGGLILDRYENPIKKFKIDLDEQMSFLRPNKQLDFHFDNFIGEPTKTARIQYDRNTGKLDIEGEFLNLPVNVVDRDIEPPSPVELIAVLPADGSLVAIWTISIEDDHVGYYLFFTSTLGEWLAELCNLGRSYIDIRNPDTVEGYNIIQIYELNNGTEYFFKVRSYDTSFNESDPSNILSAIPCDNGDENKYKIQGDPYIDGLTLDVLNGEGGVAPVSGFTFYGGAKYGEVYYEATAIYESSQLYRPNGFGTIEWRAIGDSEDIMFQYRTSDDGTTWSSWSTAVDAIGIKSQNLGSVKYFQYRFIFRSTYWADSDSVRVTNIAA